MIETAAGCHLPGRVPVREIETAAEALSRFWPGPLTIVARACDVLPAATPADTERRRACRRAGTLDDERLMHARVVHFAELVDVVVEAVVQVQVAVRVIGGQLVEGGGGDQCLHGRLIDGGVSRRANDAGHGQGAGPAQAEEDLCFPRLAGRRRPEALDPLVEILQVVRQVRVGTLPAGGAPARLEEIQAVVALV